MRILLLSFLLVMTSPLLAFNVGPSARSNFGAADSEKNENQTQQTPFTATSYSSRYNNKPKGAEQVTPAATPAQETPRQTVVEVEKTVMPPTKAAAKAENPAKLAMDAPVGKPGNGAKGQDAAKEQQAAVPAEAGAAMAQLGQLQDMMKGLGGGGAAGMPDISALMGGAQQPAKKQ